MSSQLVDYEVYANEFQTKKAESAALQLSNGGAREHAEMESNQRPATTLEEAIQRGLPTYTIKKPNGLYYTLSVQKVLNDRKHRKNNQRNRMWTQRDPRDNYYPGDQQRYRPPPPPPQERSHWHKVADQYKESSLKAQRELIESRKEVQELRDKITKLQHSVEYHQKQSENWHRTNDVNCDYIQELKKENYELKDKNSTMQSETDALKYGMEQFKKAIERFISDE